MCLNPQDKVLAKRLFADRTYEPFQIELIQKVTLPGMTFVDIGAYVGDHTLVASTSVGKNGLVIAFEPDPNNYSLLVRNIRTNRISNVCSVNAAAMNYNGKVDLWVSDLNYGDHRVYDAKDEDRLGENHRRHAVSIPCSRVDDVLERYNLRGDIIKIDVQGAEIIAFEGMEKTLRNPDIIIFSEFWPYGLRELGYSPLRMLTILESFGLTVFEILEEEHKITKVSITELAQRFPGPGMANLVCFNPNRNVGTLLLNYSAVLG